jgi:NDP-sugar pyrophosphorylase family protein
VKTSVIGRNCQIGSNVKIVNSVLCDSVVVLDDCTIQNSCVGNNANLATKTQVKECTIGAGFQSVEEGDYKNDYLPGPRS